MDSLTGLVSLGALLSAATIYLQDRSPTIHFSSKPTVLAIKKNDNGSDSSEVEHKSLRHLVESRVPSLFTEFRPLWWLSKYGHITFYNE